MLKTVDNETFDQFVSALFADADVKIVPVETINRAVMQFSLNGELLAQAIYVKGVAKIKNGITSGVEYQIKATPCG